MAGWMQPEEPARAVAPRGFALWALGFRPFYLLASIFGALSIALWSLQFTGWLPRPYLPAPIWHAHEMIFGFVLAVVVGFLFTAGRNWANLPTPTGAPLAAIVALWLAARILVLTPFGWAGAIVNAAFPLAAAVGLAIPFWRAGNRRNYFFVALLVMLSCSTLAVHLGELGVVRLPGWVGIQAALDVILFIVAVMAGRVVPMFTNNGIPGAGAARQPMLEKIALGSVLVLLAADVLQAGGLSLAVLATLAAAAHLARWILWRPWKTLRAPLVWVLHAAYLWVVVHLLLRAGAALGWLPASLAAHALTVGAIGGVVIGMITRTARGHTGRPLQADGFETTCYALVMMAAVVRVFVPLAAPALLTNAVLWSGASWAAAFGLYAVRYWPVLTRPRLDGRPG
jgi:uncharacterized protein involved in response to NO